MKRIIASTLLSLSLLGCASLNMNYKREPKPIPDEVASYYDYEKVKEFVKKKKQEKKKYLIERIELISEVDTTLMDVYQVKDNGKHPAILIFPILGGGEKIVEAFADYFASNNLNCAIVHRSKEKFEIEKGISRVEYLLRQSVISNRQVIDFLESQDYIDKDKIGAFGISMGGIKSALTAAVDKRIRCNVMALAGGSLADIICSTKEPSIIREREEILKKENISLDDLHSILSKEIKSDPLELAQYINPEGTLMYIAMFDTIITRKNCRRLWKKIGKPEVIYIPLGHYSSYFAMPFVKATSLRFYNNQFKLNDSKPTQNFTW